MSLFLKKFETISQYNAYTADTENFILPNVSLTVDNNTVHYNPSTPVPPTPTHDFVEIGGVKWATMNVGANSVTDYGLYFQWGDTQGYTADQVGDGEGQKYFDWEDYKYARIEANSGDNGNSSSGSGSTTIIKYNETDGKTELETSDDAVQANWGGQWRIPTTGEYAALGNAVNTAWTADYQGSGVAGLVCTDKTDSSKVLFFPACGNCSDGSVNDVGSNGRYWSSSLYTSNVQSAYDLSFVDTHMDWQDLRNRFGGFSVRGVIRQYVVAKFNVTSTSQPTQIMNEYADSQFSAIEIDGVVQPSVVSEYTFSTTGEHIVKYTLADPTSVGDYAFELCTGLTSIDIPDSVTSIGYSAFGDCSGLTSITIPNSVTSIGQYVFQYCSGLTSVTIGSGVTSIGNEAFRYCSGLTSIDIPNSVTSIGSNAFQGCTSLTSIDIPNSVTSIGTSAFYECSGLISCTIGSGVTSIGNEAFRYCSGLTSVTVDNNNTVYDSRNNCNAIIETSTNTLIQGCNNTVIPNSVTSIGNSAFDSCTGLTSIDIPNSVTNIGYSAFGDCSGLTSITIPNSVTSIGNRAFENCESLTSIAIPSGVTSIGDWTFYECSGLTSISIPNSVTSIGSEAFGYCTSLTSCTIGSGVTSIGASAFYHCRSLSSIAIPSGVTSIGGLAFCGCSGLTSIVIPDSVTSINNSAFYNCTGLISCTIGSGVTSIGNEVFRYCSGLTSVTVNATTPPTLGINAFIDNASGRKIYVPSASVNDYKAATNWSTYASYIEPIS